jgi:hypothetical protein
MTVPGSNFDDTLNTATVGNTCCVRNSMVAWPWSSSTARPVLRLFLELSVKPTETGSAEGYRQLSRLRYSEDVDTARTKEVEMQMQMIKDE